MKNLVLGYLMAFLLAFSLTTSAKPREKAENDTDVWLTEGGEERSLKSQPLPPMAMKMKQTGKVEDGEAGGDEMPTEAEAGEEEQDIKKACKADSQKTHPVAELGTSMGKCYIPDAPKRRQLLIVLLTEEEGGKRTEKVFTNEDGKDEGTCASEEESSEGVKSKKRPNVGEEEGEQGEEDQEEACQSPEGEEEEEAAKSGDAEEDAGESEEKEEADDDDSCKCSTTPRIIND